MSKRPESLELPAHLRQWLDEYYDRFMCWEFANDETGHVRLRVPRYVTMMPRPLLRTERRSKRKLELARQSHPKFAPFQPFAPGWGWRLRFETPSYDEALEWAERCAYADCKDTCELTFPDGTREDREMHLDRFAAERGTAYCAAHKAQFLAEVRTNLSSEALADTDRPARRSSDVSPPLGGHFNYRKYSSLSTKSPILGALRPSDSVRYISVDRIDEHRLSVLLSLQLASGKTLEIELFKDAADKFLKGIHLLDWARNQEDGEEVASFSINIPRDQEAEERPYASLNHPDGTMGALDISFCDSDCPVSLTKKSSKGFQIVLID
jgi:hypothetical protein